MQKMRVWWMPQLGTGANFYIPVKSIEEAKKFMDVLSIYDQFQYENNIKPDFCNSGGVQVWDEKEQDWLDWHGDDDGEYFDEVDEYIDTLENKSEFDEFMEELSKQVSFDD